MFQFDEALMTPTQAEEFVDSTVEQLTVSLVLQKGKCPQCAIGDMTVYRGQEEWYYRCTNCGHSMEPEKNAKK